jgi:hypothetical protein
MREAIGGLDRFLVTVEVAKHRFFRWAPADALPSGSLVVFARWTTFSWGFWNRDFINFGLARLITRSKIARGTALGIASKAFHSQAA